MKRHKNKGTMNKLKKLLVMGCLSVALIECGQCVRVRPMDEEPETRTITAPIINSWMEVTQKKPHDSLYEVYVWQELEYEIYADDEIDDSHRNQTNKNQKKRTKPKPDSLDYSPKEASFISCSLIYIRDLSIRIIADYVTPILSECIKAAMSK